MSSTIHVTNVSPHTTHATVEACFRGYGAMTSVQIERLSGTSLVLVTYAEASAAKRAIAAMDGAILDGSTVQVRTADDVNGSISPTSLSEGDVRPMAHLPVAPVTLRTPTPPLSNPHMKTSSSTGSLPAIKPSPIGPTAVPSPIGPTIVTPSKSSASEKEKTDDTVKEVDNGNKDEGEAAIKYEAICAKYQRGECRRGAKCRFQHIKEKKADKTPVVCHNFRSNSSCKWGDKCRFLHSEAAPSGTEAGAKGKEAKAPSPTSLPACSECDQARGEFSCSPCGVSLCAACDQSVHSLKILQGHQRVRTSHKDGSAQNTFGEGAKVGAEIARKVDQRESMPSTNKASREAIISSESSEDEEEHEVARKQENQTQSKRKSEEAPAPSKKRPRKESDEKSKRAGEGIPDRKRSSSGSTSGSSSSSESEDDDDQVASTVKAQPAEKDGQENVGEPAVAAPPHKRQGRGSTEVSVRHSVVDLIRKYAEGDRTDVMHLSSALNSFERMLAHEEAERLGLLHKSVGTGLERHITIAKPGNKEKAESNYADVSEKKSKSWSKSKAK